MLIVPAADLRRDLDRYLDLALRQPVAVVRDGQANAVVIVAAQEYERLQDAPTGAALVAALQAGPKDERDDLAAAAHRPAVRVVEL